MKYSIARNVLLLVAACAMSASAVEQGSQLTPPQEPVPISYFGMHIHHMLSPHGLEPQSPWPAITIPQWRLWDAYVTWADLEPSKGQWNFVKLDTYLGMAESHHTDVLLTLGRTPLWAAAPAEKPGDAQSFASPPQNMEDWRAYVRAVVTHCKGHVHAYEIWNEPNLKDFWTGTPDQMVILTRDAHEIIKNIDPTAVVVSPSVTASYGIPWLSEFLSKGGGRYVDVIGYHFYVSPHTLPPEAMLPIVEAVKQVMQSNGVGEKPIWNTETGWLAPAQFESEELAAGYLARSYILLWASGVQRFYWYAWDNHNPVTLQTTERDSRTLTQAGRAYNIIMQWLVGARMDWCNADKDHTWKCQLNRNGALQWIVWNPDGMKQTDIPASWLVRSVTHLLGGAIPFSNSSIGAGPVPELLSPAN